MTLLARLDAYGTDDPGFREGHWTDRCPLCERPVRDHVYPHGLADTGARAKWPHRRAALADMLGERIDRWLA